MYGLTWLIDLQSLLDDIDVMILLTSAICHDLDHPGYNNAYQVNIYHDLDHPGYNNAYQVNIYHDLDHPGYNNAYQVRIAEPVTCP